MIDNYDIIYEKISHLFNKSVKININESNKELNELSNKEKIANFFVNENYLKYYNKWNEIHKEQWYFLSQIYWGNGLYSTLYFNKDGKLYVENTHPSLSTTNHYKKK